MIRQRIGPWLVSQVGKAHRLPHPEARCIVLAVLDAVIADLRHGASALPRETDLGLAARTLAVRLEHARDRCAVGLKWQQKPRRGPAACPHIAAGGP